MSRVSIEQLTSGLQPVPGRWPIGVVALIWLLMSAGYVFVVAGLLGPYRSDALAQLISAPRFGVEMMLGGVAVACFAFAGLRESIPGSPTRWLTAAGALAVGAWLLHFVLGWHWPVLEPSMAGKRAHCAIEAFLYSMPPTLCALWLQQRRYALRPVRALVKSAVAAGLLGALVMQVACMYEPAHILKFHVLPVVLLVAGVAAVFQLAKRLLPTDDLGAIDDERGDRR